jgi:hypothetical protein
VPVIFEDSEALLNAIRKAFNSRESVEFEGSYVQTEDPLVSDKDRVRMTIHDVWKVTGYRFT